ncbi:MAG: ribonucleoside triphosphate reductase [Candidatus Sumerlaeota bacterium]|nr:ribonucleoside triphosphate reductase [Candidatus Sumerlaeota bacterium]
MAIESTSMPMPDPMRPSEIAANLESLAAPDSVAGAASIAQAANIKKIRKRDGKIVPWNPTKIFSALLRAGQATNEYSEDEAFMLTAKVIKALREANLAIPNIEEIQDAVEKTLIHSSYLTTARAYIVYREQRSKARADKRVVVEVESAINEYLDQEDWRVNENANQGYSLGGMILNLSGKMVANYWLNHIYPAEIGDAHRNADFYLHDLGMLSGYCAGWSLRLLLEEGFNGVPGKVEAGPPKHLSSAVGQMVNFLGTLQNEWAGAQAFSSFDTYLAPFVRLDNLTYEDVYQNIQEFIFNLNVPSRWGTQTPFTNITLDWTCPEDLRGARPRIGGKDVPFTYGELQGEMDMINRAYLEVMMRGDAKGRVFTFPIPTYNITKEFDWDSPNADLLFEMTAKYGLPYFQNFLNSDLKPQMIRSMCCRLRLDVRELLTRGNGLFGSAEQTGSVGVVTINCARLGYLFRGDKEGLYRRLEYLLRLAKTSLELKRKAIQGYMDRGLFPFTRRYLKTLRNHFSTIGVNGVNEMIRNFTNGEHDISSEYGQKMAGDFLDHIRDMIVSFQKETEHLYNLEATPAEGTTYRLAREDKKRFPDILQAGTPEAPYYTNSTQLPARFTDDPFKALDLQHELQRKYTGGTVFHVFLGERVSSSRACKELVRRVLGKYRIPYLTITPTFSICPSDGYLAGEHPTCPKCGQTCEVWTRVMGYHRPVSQFNKGKKSEYAERQTFKETLCACAT